MRRWLGIVLRASAKALLVTLAEEAAREAIRRVRAAHRAKSKADGPRK